MRTVQERFEAKFAKGPGCWEWIGAKHPEGYGSFGFEEGIQYAHRISYQLYVGEIPNGLCVCHRCDNPGCVNPDHLFLGTHVDNMRDGTTKGRFPSGENQWRSKLIGEDIPTIRTMSVNGVRQIDIAKRFGVSRGCISAVIHSRTWAKILKEENQ